MEKSILNKYKIINKNSSGSFSTIYKVSDESNNIYAIKKINAEFDIENINKTKKINNDINQIIKNIIENEITIHENIKNKEHILSYKEHIKEDDTNYFLMEYIDDINTYYKDNKITNDEIVLMSIDICDALMELEKNNLVHGDIKPSNIFKKENKYLLGDFSSLIEKNQKVIYSTKNYMSPEIYKNEEVTYASDIYSLGIIMYLLLSGDLPFIDGKITEEEAFKLRMKGDVIPDIFNIDSKLMSIVKKACAFSSKERFASANEMKEELLSLGIKRNHKEINKDEIITERKVNIKNEPTISIYDETLLKTHKKNTKAETLSIVKKAFNKNKFKKYCLILVILLFSTFIFAHYSKNKTCNIGYVNKSGLCIKGSYYCPKGYSLNSENKCQKTIESKPAKITYTCKNGYNLVGEMCVNNDVKDVTFSYKCLDGFKLNGQKCQKVETSDAVITYTCPSGYVNAGDQCVTVSNVPGTKKYKCPDSSYAINGTTCSKLTTKTSLPEPKYSCESGGDLNGMVCEYKVSAFFGWRGPSCSKGTFNVMDGKCHYTESAKITYTCSKGTLNSSGMCVYEFNDVREATLGYVCPSGYVSVGSECAKTTGIKATEKYNCLDGSKLSGKKCQITITTDAIGMYTCPDGYVASGSQCFKDEFLQPVKKYSCSRIYKLNGGNCEKYDIISPKIKYN